RAGAIRLRDPVTGRSIRTLAAAGPPGALAFSPDGLRLAAAGVGGMVQIWETATGASQARFWSQHLQVLDLAWDPSGRRLASAGNDETARVWDVPSGPTAAKSAVPPLAMMVPSRKLRGHSGKVRCLAWDPDGSRLATTDDDKRVRVWDVASEKELFYLQDT